MAQWTKTPLRHLLYLRQSTKSGLSTKGNAAFANDKNANLQQLRPYFRLIGKNWWFA